MPRIHYFRVADRATGFDFAFKVMCLFKHDIGYEDEVSANRLCVGVSKEWPPVP